MDDRPYSNRELDAKFENLAALISEKHDDTMNKMGEVVVQTTKTNGSVASLKLWRAYITGALAVLSFLFVAFGVPLILAIIHK